MIVSQMGGVEALVQTRMKAGDREDNAKPAVSLGFCWVFLCLFVVVFFFGGGEVGVLWG